MDHKLELADGQHVDYRLQSSRRAKYLRINISCHGEVKVVVPSGCSNRQAHEFVQLKKNWVEKHLKTFAQRHQLEIRAPKEINLQLLDEIWRINLKRTEAKNLMLRTAQDYVLQLSGNTQNTGLVFSVLEKWLKARARGVFPVILDDLAARYGFQYNRLSVRGQKTRWGSCSGKGNINLNYKLLFFSAPVVRYVMIHELCHTLEMNHSSRFWKLVEQYDADYQLHRKVLHRAHEFIPAGL